MAVKMAVEMLVLKSHEEWLKNRFRIGGSDASAVIGMNPWKTNVELWEEKTGLCKPADISDKPYIQYGHQAEPLLRELFKLDFPEYQVFYEENNLFLNNKYPWGHFSADGWLLDEKGRKGVLEIKTTEILQSMQKEKWNKRLPDNYYIQLLHGLLIMEADFAVLKAQLKTVFDGVPYLQTKHYHIERSEVEADIQYLATEEEKFWRYVESKQQPPLILPNI
ncbi:MAG: YqaJ viral recombinase family protein [Bacteroidales bacterium]|nr:YqaJ viral recombinase family protein [Bacteroidales bacterium]